MVVFEKGNRLLVVLNPVAGGTSKDEAMRHLRKVAKACGLSVSIFRTTGKRDDHRLAKVFAKGSFSVVVVLGGDGSVRLAASLLVGSKIPLLIIPLGSANGLAKELGVPLDPFDAVDLLGGFSLRPLDALEVNGSWCFHFLDMGLHARVVKRYAARKARGFFGYLRSFFSVLRRPRRLSRFSFVLDGKEFFQGDGVQLVIANGRSFGSGFVVNPAASLSDGFFEVVVFGKHIFGPVLFSSILGRRHARTVVRHARKVVVDNIDGLPVQVDGESWGTPRRLIVRMRKNALSVMLP